MGVNYMLNFCYCLLYGGEKVKEIEPIFKLSSAH